ncbi:31765_t:CDS:2, partial [Racocetra persica]
PENDAVDLTLEVDESQFFNSENEKENETNSSQDDLNGKKSQLQLHIGLIFDTTDFHSDNSGIRHHSYKCSKSCVHKAKKIVNITKQHECHSTAIDCEWHINFNNHKGTTEITCTSLVDKHNHEMDPIIDQTAPRFRRLSEEMLEDI